MIRVLNIVQPESQTLGWRISIDKNGALNKYKLGLVSSKSRIGLNIHPDSYIDLTTAVGVDPYKLCKLISIEDRAKLSSQFSGERSLVPYIVSATEETDNTIILLNYEVPLPADIIYDINLKNCEAISYYINNDDESHMSASLALISIDSLEPSEIRIATGFPGGMSLTTELISIEGRRMSKSIMNMEKSYSKIDLIEKRDIVLPKFDLSKVLIEEER